MYPVFCQVWNPQSADVPVFLFEINQIFILGILKLFTAIFLVLGQAYQNIISSTFFLLYNHLSTADLWNKFIKNMWNRRWLC